MARSAIAQGSCVFSAREHRVSRDASVRKRNLRTWRMPRDDFGFLGWKIYFLKGCNNFIIQMKSLLFLNQWAWFSMSTRNFIGFGQNSVHPLLDRDGWRIQQLRGVVVYLTCVDTAYRETHLYANEIYVRDERNAMILVS